MDIPLTKKKLLIKKLLIKEKRDKRTDAKAKNGRVDDKHDVIGE